MDQVAYYWNIVVENVNFGLMKAAEAVSFLTGLSTTWSYWILIVIVLYIILFALILPIHRKVHKSYLSAQKACVVAYDEIIYLLAKQQYVDHIDKDALGGDPCIELLKTMFKSGDFNYLDNAQIIKDNVHKVEHLLQKTIVSDELWKKVEGVHLKIKFLLMWDKVLGWILTGFTLGIYKLFR